MGLNRPVWLRIALPLACVAVLASSVARAQDDEDEDEGPAAPAPAAPASPSPAARAPVTPPPAKAEEEAAPPRAVVAPQEAPPQAVGDQGYMQGYAQSTSPNERIHTVQQKSYTAAGKLETTVYPLALQINSKFVNTDGFGVAVSYALQENMDLQVLGFYNYVSGTTPFTQNLLDVHARPEAPDTLSLTYGGIAAFEVAPVYGKFAFYDKSLVQFRFVLNAGAGIGGTQVQLTPGASATDSTAVAQYGNTGTRFLGNLGAGFRLLIGTSFALRFEVRDLIFAGSVNQINGCNLSDVTALINNAQPGSSGCSANSFNPQAKISETVAQNLLGDGSSDVVNNIMFFAGASLLF